MRKTNLGLTLR